jgi:hypothetical protein
MRCFPRPTIFLAIQLLLVALPALAAARDQIVLNSPRGLTIPGQDLLFDISTQGLGGRLQAAVFLRAPGQTAFQRLPLDEAGEERFAAVLPGGQVPPEGIEFYVEVRNDANQAFTLPAKNPLGQPRRLTFATGQSATQPLDFPDMNNAAITSRRPVITAPLPPETLSPGIDTVRIALDDVDVTALAAITDTTVSYTPEADLDYGPHHVIVETLGQDGQPLPQEHWYFSIPQSAAFDSAEASFQLDTDLGLKLADDGKRDYTDWTSQTSGTLSAAMSRGDLKVTLDANAWYIDDSDGTPGQDELSVNTYLLRLDYRRQSLSLGDVMIETPELTGGYLAQRGGLLDLNTPQTSLQGFLLRSNTVTDIEDSFSLPEPERRYLGAMLTRTLSEERDVKLKATAISGKSTAFDDYDGASLLPSNEGQIYSVQLSGTIVDQLLLGEAEYAESFFDLDSGDDLGRKRGQAWRTRLWGRRQTLDYGGAYASLDRDFQSIIAPDAANNRREYTLFAAKAFEESSMTLNAVHSYDNAERLDNIPTIRNTGLDLGYSLNKPDWPFLFANANLNWQTSGHEPDEFEPVDNQSRILAVGLSLARDTWSFVPSYVFTSLEDSSAADMDGTSHQILLSVGWQPLPVLSFNPAVTYAWTETDPGSLVVEDWLATLTATWLVDEAQNLSLTASCLDSRAEDDSVDLRVYSGQAQYNWVLGLDVLQSVTKTIGLRGQYSRTRDHAADDDIEEYVAFLSLNFSIPVAWP